MNIMWKQILSINTIWNLFFHPMSWSKWSKWRNRKFTSCVYSVRSLIVFFPSLGWYVVATPSTSESLVGQQDPGSSTASSCYTPLQDSHLDSPFCIPSLLEAQHLLMPTEWKRAKLLVERGLTENKTYFEKPAWCILYQF